MTAEDTTTLTSARLDLWLWSVRIFKTRSLAADECKGGHAASTTPRQTLSKLKRGVVRVRYPGWERVFKVENSLVKREAHPSPSPATKTFPARAPPTSPCRRSPNANEAAAAPPRRNAAPSTNYAAEAPNRASRTPISQSAPRPARQTPAAAAGSSPDEHTEAPGIPTPLRTPPNLR